MHDACSVVVGSKRSMSSAKPTENAGPLKWVPPSRRPACPPRVLNRVVDSYGAPDAVRLDKGSAMVSGAFTQWAASNGIAIRYIQQPGKPSQNAFIERFNHTYRKEVNDAIVCKRRAGAGHHALMAGRLQRTPPI